LWGEALHDEAEKATKEVTTWQTDKTLRDTNYGIMANLPLRYSNNRPWPIGTCQKLKK